MPGPHIGTYLNDHLAGAAGAIELLEHLERARAGTPMAPFAAGLRVDILADRGVLEDLMKRHLSPVVVGSALGEYQKAVPPPSNHWSGP